MKEKLLLIWNGMAGLRFLQKLTALAPDRYDITVIGEEPHSAYNRILLSPVLAGEKSLDDIMLAGPDWYEETGITLITGKKAIGIDRDARRVSLDDGQALDYDRLVLATGSHPIMIPLPGHKLAGVLSFRDIKDVNAMIAASETCKRAVVIGGGLLGLEAANGLLKRGMDVTVVHLMATLMERQLDETAGNLLRRQLEDSGMKFVMPAETECILGTDCVEGLRFKDGLEIPADLVVMAVGIRPNADLARASGLDCNRGALVDDWLCTSDPSIFALGECVEHQGKTYGLVAPLYDQAAVLAAHLAGPCGSGYQGSTLYTSLKVTGVHLFSAGDFQADEGREELLYFDPEHGVYKKLLLDNNRLCGAVLYGDTSDGPWYNEMIAEGRNIAPLRENLIFGRRIADSVASCARIA